MFEPGHLHRASLPGGMPGAPEFALDLHYLVRLDPVEGLMLDFRMTGEVNGKPFEEAFQLHRDTAFNFASTVSRLAAKHGLAQSFGAVLSNHHEYDLMFDDIREKLKSHAGEPVNLDHLLKDGF